ncbi:histone-lysine N-methyltransferase SETMAR [Plakobranchus ocellatus]|uniref:Histone-lysine N-methyltransferase SETMAR n=1 Tax=Plakobranchus ocellatus TaxID=259542 RepID=A0AAV3YIQ8_9GAST|nr:histone-lysine N-methyltransferase SETMAR [Plakobranchus ocellatus]
MVAQDKLRPAIRKSNQDLCNLESSSITIMRHAVHTARMVTEPLDEYEWSVLEHPRYSPDLTPRDSDYFQK